MQIPWTPATWSEHDLLQIVRLGLTRDHGAVRAFVEGDHWQKSFGWTGPRPAVGEQYAQDTLDKLEAAFVSRNVIGEVTERHAGGVAGTEPTWGLTPIEALGEDEVLDGARQALRDEAEAALTAWWDRRQAHTTLAEAVKTLTWAGRAPMRLYIPRGLLRASGGTVRRQANLDSALGLLWVEAPRPEVAHVITDDDTKDEAGVMTYTMPDGRQAAEITYLNGAPGDERRLTAITTVLGNARTPYLFDFGGRLTMFEMVRVPIVSAQVVQNQKALNLSMTVMPRNVITGGFLERVLLNAQTPGRYVVDDAGQKTFVPSELAVGANVTAFINGFPVQQPDGTTRVTDPKVSYRDPVPVGPTVDAKTSSYRDILEEVDQAHVLTNSDANASGRSRQHARSDYATSLRGTISTVQPCGRWLLETALAMAEALMGAPGRYTSVFRVEFACNMDTGPIEAAERAQNIAEAKDGYLSRETAMQLNAVADVDAEIERMNAQEDARLTMRQRQAEVVKAWVESGMDVMTAARMAGLPDDDLAMIARELIVPEEPEPLREDPSLVRRDEAT